MRNTLRRSCAACAKAKHSCDLRTPRCSRCISKRVTECIYANEPLTAAIRVGGGTVGPSAGCGSLSYHRFSSVDPFDSYPRTRLPKETVQRLIYSCAYSSSRCASSKLTCPDSPSQDLFPILSSGPGRSLEPVCCLLVATGSWRPSTISCFSADSLSRRGPLSRK